MIIWKESKGGV